MPPCLQDKINAFWEITKKDLEDKKAELRNKDREMEELEERHQLEIKVSTILDPCPSQGCRPQAASCKHIATLACMLLSLSRLEIQNLLVLLCKQQ